MRSAGPIPLFTNPQALAEDFNMQDGLQYHQGALRLAVTAYHRMEPAGGV
jgi:hypothetical protein